MTDLRRNLMGIRIVVFALFLGVVSFTVIALVVGQEPRGGLPLSILTGAAVVLSIPALVVPSISRGILVRRLDDMDPADTERRFRAYLGQKLLSSAIIEGAGLFWSVLVLLSSDPRYAVGSAACAVLLLLQLPGEADFEEQVGRLEDE